MKLSFLVVVLGCLASSAGRAQTARRIAVHSFEDIGASGSEQVGRKLSDRLLSKLADSGVYQMIDRQFLERVMGEQQMAPGRFDASTAVAVGKLLNVSAIVDGTITTFTVNQRSSEDSVGYYGTVTVAATARLISTETGAILKAPVASEAARGMVQVKPPPPPQANCRMVPFVGRICSPPTITPPSSAETKTMDQLLDDAIEACARSLATSLAAASSSVATSSVTSANLSPPAPANAAVVIGVSEGLTYLNKGARAGLRVGQAFQVSRMSAVPGLADPETGKPLTRKSLICTLTLSDVEETSSSGKCTGNPPASQDLVDLSAVAPDAPSAAAQASPADSSGTCAGNTAAPDPRLNGVSLPVVISKQEPEATLEARRARLYGSVILSLVVDENGNATQVCVIRGLGLGLDQNAVEAVRTWKFRPGMKDGKPVSVVATVEVTFRGF